MTETERAIRRIHDDVQSFDTVIGNRLGSAHLGYEFLYAPPVPRPPMLFVDYQPLGGGDLGQGTERPPKGDFPWPSQSEYGLKPPPDRLAQRLQKAFGADLLEQCSGLNTIFWRSPRETVISVAGGKHLWAEIERFSIERMREVLHIIKPELLVVLGQKAAKMLVRYFNCRQRASAGVPVAWIAEIDGFPAYGVPHPSAALTNRRLEAIARYISGELARLSGVVVETTPMPTRMAPGRRQPGPPPVERTAAPP
jgi:hypothetical protein